MKYKKTIPCVPQTLNIKLHHFQNNLRICWGSIVQCRLLQTVRSCTFDNLRKSPFTHDRKQSLFLRRFRGICVPRTLWWPLSYLTLIGRNDIVKPRAVTWHCSIFQIKSLIGWFEIRFGKAYKNTFAVEVPFDPVPWFFVENAETSYLRLYLDQSKLG